MRGLEATYEVHVHVHVGRLATICICTCTPMVCGVEVFPLMCIVYWGM